MLQWIIVLGIPGLALWALVKVGNVSWHFQGVVMLGLCLFGLALAFVYGPGWFGIS